MNFVVTFYFEVLGLNSSVSHDKIIQSDRSDGH
jgi:hypothetical protein